MSAPWIVGFVALWLVAILTALTVLGLLRRVSAVLEQAEARLLSGTTASAGGAPPGTVVRPFKVEAESGSVVRSDDLFSRPSIVLFMDKTCEPCAALAKRLEDAGHELDVPLFVIFPKAAERMNFDLPANAEVFYQSDRQASRAFQNSAIPQAFGVGSGGIIRAVVVPASVEDIRRLAEELQRGGDHQEGMERELAAAEIS